MINGHSDLHRLKALGLTLVPRGQRRSGAETERLRRVVVVEDGAVGLVVDQVGHVGALLVLGVADGVAARGALAGLQVGVAARGVTADRTLVPAVRARLEGRHNKLSSSSCVQKYSVLLLYCCFFSVVLFLSTKASLTFSSRSSSLSSRSSCCRHHSYSTWTCALNFPASAWVNYTQKKTDPDTCEHTDPKNVHIASQI